MPHCYSYETVIGPILLVEDGGKIVRLQLNTRTTDGAVKEETPLIKKAFAQLDEYFHGKRKTFDIPIGMKGTDFQKSVWNALLTIPYGQTATYGDIAAKVGNPKGCRAVGMANSRNPLPIIVPCHRVIGANGSLSGFTGGLDIKIALLNIEVLTARAKQESTCA